LPAWNAQIKPIGALIKHSVVSSKQVDNPRAIQNAILTQPKPGKIKKEDVFVCPMDGAGSKNFLPVYGLALYLTAVIDTY